MPQLLRFPPGTWKWKSLSRVQLFVTPWTVACQAPLSMGFSQPEYWSGLPCPSPGTLSTPGTEPRSPALQADSLPSEPPGKRYGGPPKYLAQKANRTCIHEVHQIIANKQTVLNRPLRTPRGHPICSVQRQQLEMPILWRKLSAEELLLLHCGVGEDSWESLGRKEIQSVRESFPRQVDKKSRGPQGERGLEFSGRKKGQTFFSLYIPLDHVSCLRTVSVLNHLANPVILKCKLWE